MFPGTVVVGINFVQSVAPTVFMESVQNLVFAINMSILLLDFSEMKLELIQFSLFFFFS